MYDSESSNALKKTLDFVRVGQADSQTQSEMVDAVENSDRNREADAGNILECKFLLRRSWDQYTARPLPTDRFHSTRHQQYSIRLEQRSV